MAVTIEALREKVKHLQQELAEIHAGLDELAEAPHHNGSTATRGPAPEPDPLAGLPRTDPKELLRIFDQVAAEMGIDVTQPAPSAREVREMMLREGVRPEDNLGSRAIIEAREE